MKVPW